MPIPKSEPPLDRSLLRNDVYLRIRDTIVDGTLAPGEQLRDKELAAWLGVSRTPVREALRRLQSERRVTIEPQRGAVVAELDRHEVVELYQLRQHLEGIAARFAARGGGKEGGQEGQ